MQLVINRKLITNPDNFSQGRRGNSVQLIVIHSEGAPRIPGMADRSLFTWFDTNGRGVSAHYYVTFSGVVEQYVEDDDTAHQAGNWEINLRSIGIEHQDNGFPNIYTDAEYESGAQLIALLCKTHNILPVFVTNPTTDSTGVAIHRDINNTSCPATLDFMRLINRAKEIVDDEALITGLALESVVNVIVPAPVRVVEPPPRPVAPTPRLRWGLGVNMREAAYYGEGDSASANIDEHLNVLRDIGVKTVRFFVSRINRTAEEAADRTERLLNRLNARGMNGIVCLTDAFSERGFVVPADAVWHSLDQHHGQIHKNYWLRKIYRGDGSYLDFIRTVVGCSKDHPAVLVWELGNEFAIHPQPAASLDSEAFLKFVQEATGEIKSIDGNARVSIGLVNSNHVSPSGEDRAVFARRLYRLVDVVTIHYYDDTSGEKDRGVLDRQIARDLGKDFFVGEIGTPFSRGGDRPKYYRDEIEKWKNDGAFSVMPWQFDVQQFGGMSEDLGISRQHSDFNAILDVLRSLS